MEKGRILYINKDIKVLIYIYFFLHFFVYLFSLCIIIILYISSYIYLLFCQLRISIPLWFFPQLHAYHWLIWNLQPFSNNKRSYLIKKKITSYIVHCPAVSLALQKCYAFEVRLWFCDSKRFITRLHALFAHLTCTSLRYTKFYILTLWIYFFTHLCILVNVNLNKHTFIHC